MVHRPIPPPNPATAGTSTVGLTATTAALQPVPRRRPRPEPSRVTTLKLLLRKSGFSRGAALEMSSCVRESTARLYQSQWLSFCGWCRGRGVTLVDATIPMIVDFLIHLRRDKSISLSALKGYCTAISLVLSLTLVLQSLMVAPYEPLRDADERYLAHKTLFLVALASAKRVSEFHALSHHVFHSVDWKEVSFGFVPGFVAKTQDQSSLNPYFESFTVPALPKSRDSYVRYELSNATWPAPPNIGRTATDC